MRLFTWERAILVTLFALVACGGDGGGGSGSGSGSSSGSGGGGGNGGGNGGGSGGGGGGSGGSGGGPMCSGDKAIWDTIPKDQPGSTSLACASNSDCCFAVNDCICNFVVVNAKDFQSAQDNWYYCADTCGLDCIYQGVKLECVNGLCQTTEGSDPAQGFEFGDHCGK